MSAKKSEAFGHNRMEPHQDGKPVKYSRLWFMLLAFALPPTVYVGAQVFVTGNEHMLAVFRFGAMGIGFGIPQTRG